jgi:hypothetical protein
MQVYVYLLYDDICICICLNSVQYPALALIPIRILALPSL